MVDERIKIPTCNTHTKKTSKKKNLTKFLFNMNHNDENGENGQKEGVAALTMASQTEENSQEKQG